MLLCDAAQVDPAGKVHILGAGWTVTAAGPSQPLAGHAVVALLHVPWSETETPHAVVLRLEDADGHPVVVQGPNGARAMVHEQVVAVGRPPGAPEGITLDAPVVITVGPGVPLHPGRYVWRLEIDGQSHEDWLVSFHVQPVG